MANQQTAPLYKVLAVTPTVIASGGERVDGQRIDFSVAGKDGGWFILVPNTDFEPGDVEDQVGTWAAKIAAIMSMTGPDIELADNGQPVNPNQ